MGANKSLSIWGNATIRKDTNWHASLLLVSGLFVSQFSNFYSIFLHLNETGFIVNILHHRHI